MKVIEEERDKFQDCYYLFEMGTSIVCKKKQLITVGGFLSILRFPPPIKLTATI
jgi:hypothetical protein